jgi:hypothetical protein
MTRSTLFAIAALLAASLLSAPSQGQQPQPQPPAAGARPPAAAPQTPPAGQPPAYRPGGQQAAPAAGQAAGQAGAQPGAGAAEESPPSGEGPPWPVLVVTSVETLRSHIKGHLEIIRVRGLVTSGGWGDPHLLPITQGEPLDGVLDLIFQAHSPAGAAPLGPLMPVEAILPIEAGHPYKAVRVRGSTNAVTLKTIPGYIEAPGYEEGKAAKEDCATCMGKYFVAKGANPPAGVAADQIVREADLPWTLRVIKPNDGLPSYTFDPNRLTLVLSDDGRIVDAAWD